MQSVLDIIWRTIRYNLKIIFGNKFIFFLIGASLFFFLITGINIFEDRNPTEETVYYILLLPGILLIFYPAVFGIQNDDDNRILEILFGIPNYRFKVWLVRLSMIFFINYFLIVLLSWIGSLSISPVNPWLMAAQLMFPILFLACLSFMFSTIVKSGNGTAVVMIIIGIAFWISAGLLEESAWNIFLNPFSNPPNDMNALVWERTIFKNRIYLSVGVVLTTLLALSNMRKREKFI